MPGSLQEVAVETAGIRSVGEKNEARTQDNPRVGVCVCGQCVGEHFSIVTFTAAACNITQYQHRTDLIYIDISP